MLSVEGHVEEYPHVNAVSLDEEDEELRMVHRRAKVYAVGHGCAVDWDRDPQISVSSVATEFMPSFVLPAVTRHVTGHDRALSIAALADDSRPVEELTSTLGEFVGSYEAWIHDLPSANPDLPPNFAQAADRVMRRLEVQATRMRAGIALLGEDENALRAFRLANRAMLMQMRHSGRISAVGAHPEETPSSRSRRKIPRSGPAGSPSSSPSCCSPSSVAS